LCAKRTRAAHDLGYAGLGDRDADDVRVELGPAAEGQHRRLRPGRAAAGGGGSDEVEEVVQKIGGLRESEV
jgi:hypothetical protein